jgi:transcriptional regulator with XRE-family HTH domain
MLFTLDLSAFRCAIGANVKSVREDAGLSQEALASALLVKRTAISRIEGGRNLARLDTLGQLAFVMDLPLVALLDGLDPLPLNTVADITRRVRS